PVEAVVGGGDGGIRVVPVPVPRVVHLPVADGALLLRDEVVAVARQVRRDVGVVEADPVVDDRDQDATAAGRMEPGAPQVHQVVVPGLGAVEGIVGEAAAAVGAGGGGERGLGE